MAIALFLKHKLIGEVNYPSPKHQRLCFTPQLESHHHLLQMNSVLILLKIGSELPEVVEVADVQQAVAGSIVVLPLLDGVVVVEPSQNCLSRKGHNLV